VIQRLQRLFMPIHDAKRRGDAQPRLAMTGLIDGKIQGLTISGQGIVRASHLQHQFSQQLVARVQRVRFTSQTCGLGGERQRPLEAQRVLFVTCRFQIRSRCRRVFGGGQVIRTQGSIVGSEPLRRTMMQLAPSRF
jgi:hypothetical protein